MHDESNVIHKISQALGRTAVPHTIPRPPDIDESITRLVHSDIGLPELFTKVARENKLLVTPVGPDELGESLVKFLKSKNVKSIAMTTSPFLTQLKVLETLRSAGFNVRPWQAMTLDDVYDIDCGLTDVWAGVAEVGGLVIRGSTDHGRAVSLVPPLHIAVVEPKNLVADLVDLFQKLPPDQNDKFVIITGPSKTADIEMNLVTGVHGPGVVQVFLLQ